MDSLIDLGYWGLFIGSFLASTLIPMSADVLLVGILALGGNVWACLVIATTGNWLGGLTSYRLAGPPGMDRTLAEGEGRKAPPSEKKHKPLWSMAGPVYLASACR